MSRTARVTTRRSGGTSSRRRFTAGAAAIGVAALMIAGASGASAAGPVAAETSDPTSTAHPNVDVDGNEVTITVDLAAVQQLCAKAPDVKARIDSLTERVQGGSDVAGSTAAIQARAAKARTAGHTELADQLDVRATRRAGHVTELEAASARVQQAIDGVCASIPAAA